MRKIVSRQVPCAVIARPLLTGGLLIGMAAGVSQEASAQQTDYRQAPTYAPGVGISSALGNPSEGCVVGAQDQRTQPPQKNCRQVGCVVKCD